MKTCKNGHEVEDDNASHCPVCHIFLKGHPYAIGREKAGTQGGSAPGRAMRAWTKSAKRWIAGMGINWDDLPPHIQDLAIDNQRPKTPVGKYERLMVELGAYKPKPVAGKADTSEAIVAEITAESVEQLEKSLKTLRRLAHERKVKETD